MVRLQSNAHNCACKLDTRAGNNVLSSSNHINIFAGIIDRRGASHDPSPKKEINDFMADVNKEEQTLGIRNAVLAASALRRALASRSLVPDACCGKKTVPVR
jgi:hypothetical protein